METNSENMGYNNCYNQCFFTTYAKNLYTTNYAKKVAERTVGGSVALVIFTKVQI